jgi:hypothetical protein
LLAGALTGVAVPSRRRHDELIQCTDQDRALPPG